MKKMIEENIEKTIEKTLSFSTLTMKITRIGRDYNIILMGGQMPHIGCTVLAIPRMSLSGSGEVSVTSSVLNVIGHKDEYICRYAAEEIAKSMNAVVVCSGGFHMDHISNEQIKEVIDCVKIMTEDIQKCLNKL